MHYFSNYQSKQRMFTNSQMQSNSIMTESTAVFNLEKLHSLRMPVAPIKGVHSSSVAASTKPDDAGGLYPSERSKSNADHKPLATGWSLQWCCWNSLLYMLKVMLHPVYPFQSWLTVTTTLDQHSYDNFPNA